MKILLINIECGKLENNIKNYENNLFQSSSAGVINSKFQRWVCNDRQVEEKVDHQRIDAAISQG
jgi:hypothetical protein